MREEEHNKDGTSSSHMLEDDWQVQSPTIPLPTVRANKWLSSEVRVPGGLSIDEMPTSKLRVPDHMTIDEMSTWILPIIYVERDTEPQKASVADEESLHPPVLKLIKSSGIYAIASMATPLIVLVLAPFLTHHLSPTEYGVLTILNTLIGLGAGITQLGLGSAFFRAYGYDYTSKSDRRDVIATVTTLLCIVSIPAVAGVAILAPFLAHLFLGQPSLGGLVMLAGVVVLLQNLSVPGYAWLRAENRALFYSFLAIGNVLVTLIATVILVGLMHLGVVGALIATGSGYASVIICMMPITLLRAGIRVRADIARSVLTFGLPLVLNFVAYWVLQLSDRYLLSLFGSLAETARYAVVYTLGSAMSVVVMGPFTLAWPTAMFAIAKRKDAPEIFRLVFRWFSVLLLFAAFGLSILGTILLDWLFPATYQSAAFIIPIIALSIAFYGVYYVFTAGSNVTRRTWLAAVFTTTAAIINVGLNLFLIPHYGAMGAALSTLLAYVALAGVAYVVNQRIYPIPFEISILIIALLIGAALYIGSDFLGRGFGKYGAWGIAICALIFYGGCLALLGKLLPTRRY